MFLTLSSSGSTNPVVQFIVVLLIFIGVLGLTFYTTKWVAGYQKKINTNKNLKIIETIKVSSNKYLEIVEAGKDKYFLIGIGKDEVTSIGEIPKDALDLDDEEKESFAAHSGTTASFKEFFNAFKSKKDDS